MTKTKVSRKQGKPTENKTKRESKKQELARHTLETLSTRGYANTSLRDIAEQSNVSVGVLHYYFEDKVDLISYCVQLYKDAFIARLDSSLLEDGDDDHILHQFIEQIIQSVQNEGKVHRLWYDIRGQALFNPEFQGVVDELEEALISLNERFLARVEIPDLSPRDLYFGVDARFRYFLQKYLAGNEQAVNELRVSLHEQFQFFRSKSQG